MSFPKIPTETISKLSIELSNLFSRAKRVNYKNIIPRLPKNPTVSTMSGFNSRLKNWRAGLEAIETELARQTKHTVVADSNLLENLYKK